METAEFETQLLASIRQIGIPPRPVILEKIAMEMRRDEPDLITLARIISADVSISGSLLKVVNSPYFGYRTKARTVQDALTMLGLANTASTIATIVLRNVLPPMPAMERFWDASARVAEISGWLAQEIGRKDGVRSEDAYTFSLFRDCGIPIMMRKFPQYIETLAIANADTERAFTEVEESRHPTNHAVVGSLLGQSWWLPENTCQAIRHHHDFVSIRAGAGALSPTVRRLIALSQLAERIDQEMTGQNQSCEWHKMGEACLELLDLSAADLPALQAGASELMRGHAH